MSKEKAVLRLSILMLLKLYVFHEISEGVRKKLQLGCGLLGELHDGLGIQL